MLDTKYHQFAERQTTLVEQLYHNYCDAWYIRNLGGCSTILDVGSGDGRLARKLRDIGFKVTCLEPDEKMCQQLRFDGFETIDYGFENFTDEDKKYDAVIFSFGVLNFVADIDEAVEKATRLAKFVVLGWVSNHKQVGLMLNLTGEDYQQTTKGWFPYHLISKNQWGIQITQLMRGYSFNKVSRLFKYVKPFPALLFALQWGMPNTPANRLRASQALQWDVRYPNKEWASGFLVKKVIR